MRIAVYGGSFNPPHVGHAMVAGWVRWTGQADEVWVMPAFSHAFGKQMAAFEERVAMVEALCRDVGPWLRPCAIESELPVPSYTIDTLDALARRFPQHDFRLVVGSDTLDDTHAWKRWDRIEAEYRPIVAGRAGYTELDGVPTFPDVSSTEVRRRLAAGASVEGMLTEGVRAVLPDSYRSGPKPTKP